MSVTAEKFGTSREGRDVMLYTISGANKITAKVMNLGAILVELDVPDADGKVEDIVLGFDSVEPYYGNPSFFGATIGPNANRIGGASYEIDGVNYQLDVNDNDNNLHSHAELGYHKRVWDAEIEAAGPDSVTFTIEDPATLGFPGNKKLSVTYTVTPDSGLKLTYRGTSDEKTILNPTNHTYFNLDGMTSGSIEDESIQIEAASYTPTLPGSIPTGEIAPVAGTPLELTKRTRIGDHIDDDFEQLTMAQGYDHNFCIDGYDGSMRLAATVAAAKSGRVMKVYTNLPGIQFYAGNCIAPQEGKGGTHYDKRYGLCLETQYYPDAIHHANFQSCVFGGNDADARVYESETVYQFGVDKAN